jgi:hypothetical protein
MNAVCSWNEGCVRAFWKKGFVMLQIKESVGSVVAADTQSSIETLDRAVAQQSRMCASVIEAAHDSHLAIATTQPLLEALSASVRGLVESRANLAKAVREVAVIQAKSNLRETGFGCPNGWEPRFSTASAPSEAVG